MRSLEILLFSITMIMATVGCQKGETMPTQTPAQVSPRPTLPIGVTFATVTAGVPTAASTPSLERSTSTPQAASAAPTPELYLVKAGDTLVGIAAARGTTLDEILALNPEVQPELLLVGQAIAVPPMPTIEAAGPALTPRPPSAEIRGLSTYGSATGGTWVLGEVFNPGPSAAELLRVRISLISSAGEVMSEHVVWVTPAIIPAMSRAPFGALFPEVSPGEATAAAEIAGGREVYQLGNRYLNLAVTEAEVTIGRNPIRVSGQVENNGQQRAGQISVVTTFYDERDGVTGYHELTLAEVLEPGERRPFEFIALPPGGGATRYEFAVQATAVQ
jgi:LysM repeat protein